MYLPFSNNSKYDVIAVKDGILKRISTKFTSTQKPSGVWEIELRQISRRKDNEVHIDKFDNTQFDLIAVYIGPKDKVILIEAKEAKTRGLYIKA